MMASLPTDREVRLAISHWLKAAETEVRVSFAQVQRDGSDPCRARYAAALRERDVAEQVLTQLITWRANRAVAA